jgi:hypothetical protein
MLWRKSKHAFYFQWISGSHAIYEKKKKNEGGAREATDDSIISHRKDVICMPDS